MNELDKLNERVFEEKSLVKKIYQLMWGSYTFFSKDKDLFLTQESVKAEKTS